MPRKSKAKYEMKGHSIPGIKGFKNTTLEDGKAASSAFQMQSPLYVEGDDDGTDAYKLDDINVKSSDYDPNRATTQRAGQSGASYGLEQLGKLAGRKRDKKAAEKMEDQTTKYDGTTDLEEGQQGPQPETDQDGDGVLDSEQVDVMKDNNPNDNINAPDYMINKSGKDMSNEELQKFHDNKVQNLINKAQSGTSTSEGSSAFMDIKKIYPEKSNEEITAMIKRGKI